MGSIHLYSDNVSNHLVCTSGLNDGMVNMFDMRTNKPVFSERLHKGAINQITSDLSGNSNSRFKQSLPAVRTSSVR